MRLTDKQNMLLSEFSYLDFDDFRQKHSNKKLGDVVSILLKNSDDWKYPGLKGGNSFYEAKQIMQEIIDDPVLSNLKIKDYQNNNSTTGFVAYAFENNNGDTYIAFTGSESQKQDEITTNSIYEALREKLRSLDWVDNYLLGLKCRSEQFQDIENFTKKNMSSGKLYVTGHSKGGANALYACSVFDGVTGTVFDAPGIGQALTGEQRQRLIDSGAINIIAAGDIVGCLLRHDEKRVFAQQLGPAIEYNEDANGNITEKNWGTGPMASHFTDMVHFDENGNVIQGEQGPLGKLMYEISNEFLDINEETNGVYGANLFKLIMYHNEVFENYVEEAYADNKLTILELGELLNIFYTDAYRILEIEKYEEYHKRLIGESFEDIKEVVKAFVMNAFYNKELISSPYSVEFDVNQGGSFYEDEIKVDLRKLENNREDLRRVVINMEYHIAEYVRFSYKLDEDIKNRSGIDGMIKDIQRQLDATCQSLRNATDFLKKTKKEYEKAEREIQRKEEQLLIDSLPSHIRGRTRGIGAENLINVFN